MTELVLVRHAETVWHAGNRYAGRSDVALTERGRKQAERLRPWAERAGFDRVVASPLRRAVDTATPAAAGAGIALCTDARLVEVDFGDGEGLTRDEMRARFPDELAAFLRCPASRPLPGGETGADAVARAGPAVADACDGARRVLVVTHNTLIRLLLCHTLGLPLDRYRQAFPRIDNVAASVVRVPPAPRSSGSGGSLLALNVPVC